MAEIIEAGTSIKSRQSTNTILDKMLENQNNCVVILCVKSNSPEIIIINAQPQIIPSCQISQTSRRIIMSKNNAPKPLGLSWTL